MTRPLLLSLIPLSSASRQSIDAACDELGLDLRVAGSRDERQAAIAEIAGRVRVLLTNGTTGLQADEMAAMTRLGLVAALGVGFERIDIGAARSRGIAVVNGAGSNAGCVADHALGLLLAAVRGIRRLDLACRDGIWRDQLPMFGQLSGTRVGIVGFGTIGQQIAKRLLGFDAEVAYHARSARADSPLRYFGDRHALAQWCDHLIVATPGGAATQHLINAEVLARMRSHGCLVNVARGSVVDTAALAGALRAGQLGGAGLDVYESEPEPPRELFEFANVVLTPHVAGTSPEAIAASVGLFIANLRRFSAADRLLTPVP